VNLSINGKSKHKSGKSKHKPPDFLWFGLDFITFFGFSPIFCMLLVDTSTNFPDSIFFYFFLFPDSYDKRRGKLGIQTKIPGTQTKKPGNQNKNHGNPNKNPGNLNKNVYILF
jgi:hypothetical protein